MVIIYSMYCSVQDRTVEQTDGHIQDRKGQLDRQMVTYIRRRIKTEEKAKVVASVWGGRIYLIPCRASCFALDDLNYRMNCPRTISKKRMKTSYCSKSA